MYWSARKYAISLPKLKAGVSCTMRLRVTMITDAHCFILWQDEQVWRRRSVVNSRHSDDIVSIALPHPTFLAVYHSPARSNFERRSLQKMRPITELHRRDDNARRATHPSISICMRLGSWISRHPGISLEVHNQPHDHDGRNQMSLLRQPVVSCHRKLLCPNVCRLRRDFPSEHLWSLSFQHGSFHRSGH